MNAKEIIDLSILAQELPPSMLDYQGKRDGLDFIRMGNHVVFRPSVLTGHAGYRVHRGPDQKPWWWTPPKKTYPEYRSRVSGYRDPIFACRR